MCVINICDICITELSRCSLATIIKKDWFWTKILFLNFQYISGFEVNSFDMLVKLWLILPKTEWISPERKHLKSLKAIWLTVLWDITLAFHAAAIITIWPISHACMDPDVCLQQTLYIFVFLNLSLCSLFETFFYLYPNPRPSNCSYEDAT